MNSFSGMSFEFFTEGDYFRFLGLPRALLTFSYAPERSISSMRDFASNPEATSLIPCSRMCLKSCLPDASMKVTLLRSTRIHSGDSVDAVACQHFSSSPMQAPASFPSMMRRAVPELMRVVILSTVGSFLSDTCATVLPHRNDHIIRQIAVDKANVRTLS